MKKTTIQLVLLTVMLHLNLLEMGAEESVRYSAKPLKGTIQVDGKLDEAGWAAAAPSSDFKILTSQVTIKNVIPAKTNFRVLVDQDAVYVGIYCAEPRISEIPNVALDRNNTDVFAQDHVELFFDPTGKWDRFYQIAVSVSNGQNYVYHIEGGNTTTGYYGGIVESAVHRGGDFWAAEIKIPLKALYFTDSKEFSDKWRFDVCRQRYFGEELTTWTSKARRFREIGNLASGFPKKQASLVLGVENVSADVFADTEHGYQCHLNYKTAASVAGEYLVSITDEAGKRVIENQKVNIPESSGSALISNLTLPHGAKNLVKTEFKTLQGESVLEMVYPVKLKYAPFNFEVKEPFYGRCIFPGQEVKSIEGSVKLNIALDKIKGEEATLTFSGEGITTQTLKKRVEGARVDFQFDASALKVGAYQLGVALKPKGGAELKDQVSIRKLAPRTGNTVYIDKNLNMVVNGKPIFLRSWMGDESYMVSAALLKKMKHPNSAFVNAWSMVEGAQGERLDPENAASTRLDVRPSDKVFSELRLAIQSAAKNPKILAYYLEDEPECRGISQVYLKHLYDFLKENDPYLPVIIVSRSPELYTECADILSPHEYLNPHVDSKGVRTMTSPKRVGKQIRAVIDAGKSRISPWITPQAHSYRLYSDTEADFLTHSEYRCNVYAAVAAGAKGLFTYSYFEHFNSMEMRIACDFEFGMLQGLEDFLISGEKQLPVKISTTDGGIEVWMKRVNGELLLIAVNLLDAKNSTTVESSDWAGVEKLYGYRQKANGSIQDGKLKLNFEPYQVHLLTSKPRGEGLKTLETVGSEIAAAKKSLKKPGNILFGRYQETICEGSDRYLSAPWLGATLFDGICDQIGFRDHLAKSPAEMLISFPKFTPKFKKAKIYTGNVAEIGFYIWKNGDWKKEAGVENNTNDLVEFNFKKEISTEKIKITMPKATPGKRVEVYELELYR